MKRALSMALIASLLLAFALAGCGRQARIQQSEVKSMTVETWGKNPESPFKWTATESQLEAFVQAYNASRRIEPEGDTTPLVTVQLEMDDAPPIRVALSSQGFHYEGEHRLQGDLLDRQYDLLLADGKRRDARAK